MKLIIAIIQPHHLESVKTALSHVEVFRMTIMDCQGFGRQGSEPELYGATTLHKNADTLTASLRRKIQLQIAVNEEFV
ncbi:MAG: P-II family nitrogen regulator, partial [Planctomycetota bacterium]